MSDAKHHIERWREAGVLDAETAGRLIAFESADAEAPKPEAFTLRREDLPSLSEALLYLGVVVLGVGVFALAAQNWEDLRGWARMSAVGVPALLALIAGAAMLNAGEPGVRRGGQAAWVLAVGLLGGSVAVAFDEFGDLGAEGHGSLLMVAAPTAAVALSLWVVSPKHPQVIALAGATLFLGIAISNWADEFDQRLGGMAILAIALAALALTEYGVMGPRASARPAFAFLAALGPYFAGVGDGPVWAELLVFVVGAGLAALSVYRGSFTYMVIGVVAVFFELITFISRHFQERIGVPVALMLSGGLVIAGVLLLVRLRGVTKGAKSA